MTEELEAAPKGRTLLLLLDDVEKLGRKGDIVAVRRGYGRNYLLPQGKGVVADAHTLTMRARLQEERKKQAEVDRKGSEALASRVDGLVITTQVKVDPEGKMYGSVSIADILELLTREGIEIERRAIQLSHPIKEVGLSRIELLLKEGVRCFFDLKILPEGVEELPELGVEEEEEKAESEEEGGE